MRAQCDPPCSSRDSRLFDVLCPSRRCGVLPQPGPPPSTHYRRAGTTTAPLVINTRCQFHHYQVVHRLNLFTFLRYPTWYYDLYFILCILLNFCRSYCERAHIILTLARKHYFLPNHYNKIVIILSLENNDIFTVIYFPTIFFRLTVHYHRTAITLSQPQSSSAGNT